jgi:hypothetical protein
MDPSAAGSWTIISRLQHPLIPAQAILQAAVVVQGTTRRGELAPITGMVIERRMTSPASYRVARAQPEFL